MSSLEQRTVFGRAEQTRMAQVTQVSDEDCGVCDQLVNVSLIG